MLKIGQYLKNWRQNSVTYLFDLTVYNSGSLTSREFTAYFIALLAMYGPAGLRIGCLVQMTFHAIGLTQNATTKALGKEIVPSSRFVRPSAESLKKTRREIFSFL